MGRDASGRRADGAAGQPDQPVLVAARFLLRSGLKFEQAVKAFEPYDSTREENPEARAARWALFVDGKEAGPRVRVAPFSRFVSVLISAAQLFEQNADNRHGARLGQRRMKTTSNELRALVEAFLCGVAALGMVSIHRFRTTAGALRPTQGSALAKGRRHF